MKPDTFKEPSEYTDKSEVKSPRPKPTKERIAEIAKRAKAELEKPIDIDSLIPKDVMTNYTMPSTVLTKESWAALCETPKGM